MCGVGSAVMLGLSRVCCGTSRDDMRLRWVPRLLNAVLIIYCKIGWMEESRRAGADAPTC